MRLLKTILAINLLLIIISCSKKNGYPVRIEIKDGVKTISNPEFPRDGKINFLLEKELSIGADEQDENYIFNQPQDIKVAENGTIYVLDWGDTCIKVYDNQGKYIRTIGREGQGPGEFGKYPDFAIGLDGKIYIMDTMNYRISILDSKGSFIQSFRLSGLHFDIKTDENNFIYVRKVFREEEVQKMSIHRYNSKGEEVLNYGEFKVVQPIIIKRTKTSRVSTTSRVAPTTVWTVYQDGKLYAGYGDKYQISVYNPDGKLTFKFDRDYKAIPAKYYKGKPGQHKYWGVFSGLTRHWLFDEYGNIWVEIPREDNTEDFIYDIFSPEGIYIKQAYIKHRILQLVNGKAYSIVRTEEDIGVIKRFKLIESNKNTIF